MKMHFYCNGYYRAYERCPAPSGLHAKLLNEARNRSPYFIGYSTTGRPGYVTVWDRQGHLIVSCHRDDISLGSPYHHASDPLNLLSRPDSSD